MRRVAPFVVALACLLALTSRGRAEDRAARVDAALARATAFLVSGQADDGAWRSGVHGSFRDGPSLTPHVMQALVVMRQRDGRPRPAIARGTSYLLALGDDKLHFPVYTAAAVSRALTFDVPSPDRARVRDGWIAYIRSRQLNASNGWSRDDPEFGGWGYSPAVPRKPPAGQGRGLMMDSNVSATIYAVEALRAANVPIGDPALADALAFVDRCQNFASDDSGADNRFDDGGFFFMPGDATRNKAGPAGVDRRGIERYHSYGSATADGVRVMLACGRTPDHPRVIAAARWLERNFDAHHNPGTFNPDRHAVRNANYFYYCWSVSQALSALKLAQVQTPHGEVKWTEAITDALLATQCNDGSWANDISDGREDEPLVATSFVAEAIATCARIGAPSK